MSKLGRRRRRMGRSWRRREGKDQAQAGDWG